METPEDIAAPPQDCPRKGLVLRGVVGVVALSLWIFSVLQHELGGKLFSDLFDWSVRTWGPHGFHRMEMTLFWIGISMASCVLLGTAIKVSRMKGTRDALPELGARWLVWFLCALAANRFTICIQSEDIHFAQYGFVAFCAGIVTGNPRFAFLLATFLGFLDESNQWWRIYFHDWDQHEDWNDMVLNACGAAAGALPLMSLVRIRLHGEGKGDLEEPLQPFRALPWLAGLAALSGIMLGFTFLGHYNEWPFWQEIGRQKPFHVLTLREGLPALLALSTMFYFLVDERRRNLPWPAVACGLVALHLAIAPPRLDIPQAIHEPTADQVPWGVPSVKVPHARGPVTIDGKIDQDEWAGAVRLPIRCFAPNATDEQKQKQPWAYGKELETTALAQWDEKALYIAFECATDDVWARKVARDEKTIVNDSCVEVFLDPDASERTYYEFDVTPANVVQDLFVYWPQAPSWVPDPPGQNFVNLNRWDCHGLETAVTVQGGDCDVLAATDVAVDVRKLPRTKGYTVEMAIPWADLRGRALQDPATKGDCPPLPGARFRANFCRIETTRPRPSGDKEHDKLCTPRSFLAWAPTHAPLDFHRPQFFGVLELEKK